MFWMPRTMLLLSRLKKSKSGASALEFALVAPPFFLLLFATFDIALMFFAATTLENGIIGAARLIRTGQVQAMNMTQQQFRTLICNDISMLLSCDSRLGIDVRRYNGFGNVQWNAALDNNGNLVGNMQFQPGGPEDVIVVRAFYVWPVLTPGAGSAFSNMAGGNRLLEASIAFRNEPF
jgi:Flp pilus assembly protein TadG